MRMFSKFIYTKKEILEVQNTENVIGKLSNENALPAKVTLTTILKKKNICVPTAIVCVCVCTCLILYFQKEQVHIMCDAIIFSGTCSCNATLFKAIT